MSRAFFNTEYRPVPRRGFTPIEAVEFVRREFPAEKHWTCWRPNYSLARWLGMLVGKGATTHGRIGDWRWSRVRSSYPSVLLWAGYDTDLTRSDAWVGVLEIKGPSGEKFLLFAFLDAEGAVGQIYLASTPDVPVLNRFGKAVQQESRPPQQLIVQVYGGADFRLNPDEVETMFLPAPLREDIEQQVHSFFARAAAYKRLKIRYRRGFLFVGSPGTGKTMLLRQLIRQCHQRYRLGVHLLNANKSTADYELVLMFQEARRTAPAMVIMEDFDSLLRESQLSRANLLAQLDGLESQAGMLVVATTNHPEAIDPAFLHRPSRFDRVWHFPLPDLELRRRYLAWALAGVARDVVDTIADQTEGWSFAYLNELRTTAAILALERPTAAVTGEDVQRAFALLSPQYHSGRKNHMLAEIGPTTGFRPE